VVIFHFSQVNLGISFGNLNLNKSSLFNQQILVFIAETLEDHICIPLFYKNTQSILVEGLIQLSIYSPHNSDFSKEIKGRFCLSLHYYLPYPIPDEN
jgi:hypothetical protein